jgi:hypothetical protein
MKTISGWFTTVGLSGVLVAVAVLAIGGGAVALHQSTLLTRTDPIPVASQPVSASSPSPSTTAAPQATPDDHSVHAAGIRVAASPSPSPSADDRGRGRGSDDGSGHK